MRIVNLIVLLMITVMLVAGGYAAYERRESIIEGAALAQHRDLVRGFENSVWKFHRDKMLPLLSAPAQQLEDSVDAAVFVADLTSYFGGMKILSVQLYNPAQQPVITLTVTPGTNAPRATPVLLTRASSGKPTGSIIVNSYDHALAQSVLPIMVDGKLELLLVLTSDVSEEYLAFISMLAVMMLGCAVAGFGIYFLSQMNMRRAENMIARQYEENADLAAQAAAAKEETQQKSQFLANITHELRTPLNAIIGFSDILKNEFVPAPGQSQHTNYINDIHSAGTHLLSLINDILDYSKAEAGKLELEVTEVNAVKMIQNCIRLVQPRAEIAQVRVVDALPKDQVILTTDGKKFKQVLLNLLSNAVKFTPPGGTVKVSTWFDMHEDSWVFEVRDSGIGIAPKDISRAMAPFGQVDNALSRRFEGTGLGLPLTKKFVELMGGKFSIESELNKGTTVTFSLPKELKPRDGVTIKQVA